MNAGTEGETREVYFCYVHNYIQVCTIIIVLLRLLIAALFLKAYTPKETMSKHTAVPV